MGIQLFGLLLVPAILYLICKKYYLNGQELEMLLSCMVMVLTLAFNGWITYAAYLFLLGWHSIIILSVCKRTYYFDRCNKSQETSSLVLFLFRIDQQEIMLVAYAIGIWIFLRVINMKSVGFMFNGGTFLTLMNGWNCTLDQFWWINSVWFIFFLLSLFACLYLIKYETDRNNEYRKYLIDFKIKYDLAILAIIISYHIFVRMNVYALAQCQSYFESGLIIRLLWFWGAPLTTIHFFLKKHGKFEMEQPSQRAQKQNDLQQQLNRRQIDEQHSRKTNKSGQNQHHQVAT